MQEINAKLVLIGDTSVGKTSLISRFVNDSFSDVLENTVGGVFSTRAVQACGSSIRFNIWDTAGQERYRALAKMFYRDARVAILVYDITDPKSFEEMKKWETELRENGPEHISEFYSVLAVAGNKQDLVDQEAVDMNEVKQWATERSAVYAKTSAKTGDGVDALFQSIASRLIHSGGTNIATRSSVKVEESPPGHAAKCKC